jgi:hypothetical protein
VPFLSLIVPFFHLVCAKGKIISATMGVLLLHHLFDKSVHEKNLLM